MKHKYLPLLLSLATLPLLNGCSDDDDNGDPGFQARLSDFTGYSSWEQIDHTISDVPGLASAHSGTDDAYTRVIYASAGADPVDGRFPEGTRFVKETYRWNADTGAKEFAAEGGLLAMVKRGGDFNPDHNGWEWFMLAPDLSAIAAQGDNLMNGMCNGCHSAATGLGGLDYTFEHPAEVVADAADFSGYNGWSLLEETSADHPFINPAHQSEAGNATRRVYRKQLLANPALGGYPGGTLMVKEVRVDGAVVEITAMAKRGGAFNTANRGWEWFMLDPGTGAIMDRGANLMNGMCNGCHANATGTFGKDLVFAHPGDPFNN